MAENGFRPTTSNDALPVDTLTWSALLGHWVDVARAALALPDDDAGDRLRASVADIIMLQAVWFALGQWEGLPRDEQALGLNRAQVLIDKHADAIASRWADDPLPAKLTELIDDARNRLAQRLAEWDAAADDAPPP